MTSALFLNKHRYEHFYRHGRSILPSSEVDIHMVTRTRARGGLSGWHQHPLPHVTVCDDDLDNWRAVSTWIIRNHSVGRIIAVHERAVLLAAELRSEFDLPGMKFEVAELFRDKFKMKRAVRAAGAADVPEFAALNTERDLYALDWSSSRKVIKSRHGVAAKDLYIVDGLAEAQSVVRGIELAGGAYEIEEFITGQIYHCDSVVVDGEIRFASVGRYLADPASYSPGGMFGTVLVLEGELQRRIKEVSASVLKALKIQDGTTHLELFHTPDDRLVFCEVAARPPGGIIPPVIEHQYGFNILETQIRIDAGLDAELETSQMSEGACGFIAFYPGGPDRGIPESCFADLGVVEHESHAGAGDGHGGVRYSTDFQDSYVVRAADEATLASHIASIESMRLAE
ncbi:ATP-grasp domain-containing protein [Streptomyces regalis]|uniref:ATP-grasp domain-containing protein n=1 Tax=Streptomyces regalis TaxID=68262 RepID=UPI000ACBC653|nr:hypothetical protein [Streptomyces regalis]